MLIHPLLIHFPIAFNFLETFLVALAFFSKDERYRDFSRLIFKCTIPVIVIAAIAGVYDAGGLGKAWEF